MESEAAAPLAVEFGTGEVFFERHAEMRYRGQRQSQRQAWQTLQDEAMTLFSQPTVDATAVEAQRPPKHRLSRQLRRKHRRQRRPKNRPQR